jgi:hypothetical protein
MERGEKNNMTTRSIVIHGDEPKGQLPPAHSIPSSLLLRDRKHKTLLLK